MKCDELKSFIVRYNGKFIRAYEESEVYAAIAELKDENRKLKRALWMARHERACAVAQWHLTLSEYEEANKWDKVVQKTLAKAKEYE